MLCAYNRWANERVLGAAEALTAAQYGAPLPGLSAQGSFAAAMGHQLGTEAVWLARCQGESPATMASGKDFPTLESLRDRWRELGAEQGRFLAGLGDEDIGRLVTYRTMGGETYTQPLGHMLAHVVNHGTQFRAEAAVALTAMGHSPGDLDLIFYLRALQSA
ncbi:MAG: hypothetical protein GEU75_02910 [Dehalococcoidia bacterium]|nr:hypothetical protein [Dehalococcoidia bacterium]